MWWLVFGGLGDGVKGLGVGGWGLGFRGGLVFKAQMCVSLNSRLEINKEEEKLGFRACRRGGRCLSFLSSSLLSLQVLEGP